MPQPPTSPLSPLQSLDLNRNDRRRPSYPGPQWSKKGTNPSDLIKAEGFPYAPSAPLLSIEKDSAAAARQMHVRPVPAHDIRHPGPSSFSPSSCSSYGSYIGSHLYGKAAQTDWHPTQGGTNKFTPISGHERRNITDENDSSASSRLALSPSQHVGTRLSPAAPSMQRQLSLRSNDGFLFQAEEDLDPTHSENNTTALFTPVEPSRGAAHQFTIVPRPFAMPLHDHEGNGAVMPRRDSREKTTTTLKLESPWKSPGWKLREEGRPGSTGRDRSGSCLGMSQLEGEVPAVRPFDPFVRTNRLLNYYRM
ncbi:hypothetical protein QFC19_004089 [Naganishia cerealis]|uniref:Uncharacterized protein n=1 Tax=Naganishia cerealis TaxID=610337 RepID=A0ACC2VYA8_9TREE|nr:hypothetical protein QFC19_004089 [Naganishia cerealis]